MHVRRVALAVEHLAQGVDTSARVDVADDVLRVPDHVRRAQQRNQAPVLDGAAEEKTA